MGKQEELVWNYLVPLSSAGDNVCQDKGHCYHEGTAWDTFYCCRCGQVKPKTTAERLNFYRMYK